MLFLGVNGFEMILQPSCEASLIRSLGDLALIDLPGQIVAPLGQGVLKSDHVGEQLSFVTQIAAEHSEGDSS